MLKNIGGMSREMFPILFKNNPLSALLPFIRITAISCAGLYCFSFSPAWAQEHAALREFELFNQGYESYLSYQPDRAIETFRVFIREFPGSSAEDAALFWMGKALIQAKEYQGAMRIFYDIRQKHPASPYIPYANREIELMALDRKEEAALGGAAHDSVKTAFKKGQETQQPAVAETVMTITPDQKSGSLSLGERDLQSAKVREAEQALAAAKIEIERISEERDRLRVLYEEEKVRKTAELSAKITEIERRDTGTQVPSAGSPRQDSEEEKMRLQKERDDLRARLREYEENAITLREKKYTANQIFDYIIISSSVLFKMGIRDIVWASGNMYDDFITEHVLYDEAQKISLEEVRKKSGELARKHHLSREEEDYLFRYLAIRELVQQRMPSLAGRDDVELLAISFNENNRGEKVLLATEVQKLTREGKSFGTIQKDFNGAVSVKRLPVGKLPEWIAEKYRSLQYEEISDILWTEEDFILVKKSGEEIKPFSLEDASPEARERLKVSLREWVAQIR